jgi:hypothetical protein
MATIRIAGVEVARPAEVRVGRFDLTKSNRSASGRMVMEVVRAGIRRVDVTWRYLPDPELQTILSVIAANKPFMLVEYPDAGGQQQMTAYTGDITYSAWHTRGGVRIWEEVSIPFIER